MSTYRIALVTALVLFPLLGWMLTLPWLIYHYRKYGFLSWRLSLTQLTGLYGLYTCPYRIFDVDDLLLKSTGALLGFGIAPVILLLFPSQQSLLAKK